MNARLLVALGMALAFGARPPGIEAATLFGLVNTGELFYSTNSGAAWTICSTLPARDAVELLRGASGNELYLMSRSGSVYVSSDAGSSWIGVGSIPASDMVAIDVGVRPQTSLLALTATGTVWGSTDGGMSFSAVATLTSPDHVSLTHDVRGNLYALTETGVVRESSDNGITWLAKGTLPVSDAVEVEALGSDLFVLTQAGDLWSSSNAGSSWSAVGTLSQVHMSGMVLGEPEVLFATTREGEVASSSDGTNWTWVGLINQLNVLALATDLPPTGVPDIAASASRFVVGSAWPNPVVRGRSAVSVCFTLPREDAVRFGLYDVRGRQVLSSRPVLYEGGRSHTLSWETGDLSTGVYFVRLETASGASGVARSVVVY